MIKPLYFEPKATILSFTAAEENIGLLIFIDQQIVPS